MTPFMQCLMLVVVLVLAAIMAVAQMWTGYSVPMEFWAVIYAVLGFLGVPVAASLTGKFLNRIGRALRE